MKVTFVLTNECRQKALIDGTVLSATQQKLDIPLETLTTDARKALVLANPSVSSEFTLRLPDYLRHSNSISSTDWMSAQKPVESPHLSWECTWSDFFLNWQQDTRKSQSEILVKIQRKLDEDVAQMQQMLTAENPSLFVVSEIKYMPWKDQLTGYDEALALYGQVEEMVKKHSAEKTQKAKEEEEKKARKVAEWEQEKATWIAEYGSPQLRAKIAAGYNCTEDYVRQRARMEFPDFTIDVKNTSEWNQRFEPSDEAFHFSERFKESVVVWLTKSPRTGLHEDDEPWGVPLPVEAVVLRDFLGKYDLICPIITERG